MDRSAIPCAVARGVVAGYGRRVVLDGLDLNIGPGITPLLGPNGAGKTTALDVFATLARPRSGALRVLGRDALDRRAVAQIRRGVGHLPQSFGYPRAFTVREFLAHSAWLKKADARAVAGRVDAVAERVGLGRERDVRLGRLSGGMLRRVAIAHALVHGPEPVILDEPTVGLDPGQRVQVRQMLREVAESSAVLLSTHLVEDVAALGGRVLVLSAGAVVFDGPVGVLRGRSRADLPGDTPLERVYAAVIHAAQAEGRR